MRCRLLSERPFLRRKYSTADSSAVQVAVKTAFFEAKTQHGRQQCGAGCCQNASSRHKNTAAQIALLYGLLYVQEGLTLRTSA